MHQDQNLKISYRTLSKVISDPYMQYQYHHAVIGIPSMCASSGVIGTMQLSAFLQFEHFTDCSIREYRSILDELSSVF